MAFKLSQQGVCLQMPGTLKVNLKYEGNSISKLQIVIEKNRMEIMKYKQHLFFNLISIQI